MLTINSKSKSVRPTEREKMTNEKIRDAMRIANVKQWQVADALGVHEATFCVWLRHELPTEKQEAILAAIGTLSKGKVISDDE